MSAKQTPLPDLLDRVPEHIVLGIPGDEPVFPSYTNIPIGRLARQAAAELRRLSAENAALWKEREEPHKTIEMYVRECNRLESERDEARRTVREAHEAGTRLTAQRDALLEALKKAVENGCATVYANEHDECGERGCCGVVSYKPHADDCWVTTGCAAIKAVEENT